MTLRPPRSRLPDWSKAPITALDYELAQEKASALGRLGRALEQALAALAAFDADPSPADATERRRQRSALVAAAGRALWHFIVQREACGLRDSPVIMREYRVPSEVRDRMGAFPAARG
jgi:hypothetical protein